MTKNDLIFELYLRADLSKTDAKIVVNSILQALTDAIVSGQGVEIRGFGGFYKKHRPARLGINPKTNERTQVAAKFVPFFKPGKTLKARINGATSD